MKTLIRCLVVATSWMALLVLGKWGAAEAVLHWLPATDGGGWAMMFIALVACSVALVCLFSRRTRTIIIGGVIFTLGMLPAVGMVFEHQGTY